MSKQASKLSRLNSFFLVFSLVFSPLFIFSPDAHAELENGMNADVVLGQPDFAQATANNGGIGAGTLGAPNGVSSDGKRLFVSDPNNNRALIWNTIPASNFTPADVVLGQPDFSSSTANNGGIGANTLDNPFGVFSDGKKLFVAERNNNRILVWNTIPTTNFAPADVVIGQPDFTSSTANNGGIGARTLNLPLGAVFSDDKRLLVCDTINHRILIWNTIPTTNFAPADVVLGQPDFISNTANNGGIGANTLNNPRAVFSDGKRLFVGDLGNNRVLIWNTIPTANSTPADVVLGQPDFTQSTANNGGLSASTLSSLRGVFSDGKRLFVVDQSNNRLLIWNSIPTANFAPADIVLGQPNFISSTANNGGRSAGTFSGPVGVSSDGKRLFVTETTNNRILIFNIASGSAINLGPQFTQGKAVLGKVYEDKNSNGWQDKDEAGLDGVKVVSDTGIYSITDEDGKYHFPYIETGQHVLKIDESTLPEGSKLTTESPRKVVVTEGILTKVSFGVKVPDEIAAEQASAGATRRAASPLKVSVTQDSTSLKPRLSVSTEIKDDTVTFNIDCNYFLFLDHAELKFYDQNKHELKKLDLPQPLPLKYEVPVSLLGEDGQYFYQLSVFDKQGHEDRTGIGMIQIREKTFV